MHFNSIFFFFFKPHQGGFDNKVYGSDVEFSTGAAPSGTQVLAKAAISRKTVTLFFRCFRIFQCAKRCTLKGRIQTLHCWFFFTAVWTHPRWRVRVSSKHNSRGESLRSRQVTDKMESEHSGHHEHNWILTCLPEIINTMTIVASFHRRLSVFPQDSTHPPDFDI